MLQNIICLFIFIILQGLFINSMYELFRGKCVNDLVKGYQCQGNLFYSINPSFFEKHKESFWAKPLYTCPRCMASIHGTYTFWIAVLPIYGFSFYLIGVWIFDIVILVSVNWLIYKKL